MIRLAVSQLCPDCDVLYEEQGCPLCGTENGIWIQKVLENVQSLHRALADGRQLSERTKKMVLKKETR